jgi:hypothetical protein
VSAKAAGVSLKALQSIGLRKRSGARGLVNVGDHAGQQQWSEAGAAVLELALVDAVGECLGQADRHAALFASASTETSGGLSVGVAHAATATGLPLTAGAPDGVVHLRHRYCERQRASSRGLAG